jgi:RHS repeat-associated protein
MSELLQASLNFPVNPSVQDIFHARVFEEPFVPVGAEPTAAENAALADALVSYRTDFDPDDFSSLTSFLDEQPKSPWRLALLTNLGITYYRAGHYSKALRAWREAGELALPVTDPAQKPIADRALGELGYLLAQLGRMKELGELLQSVEDRDFCGPATERIAGARGGLASMQTHPEFCFRCGPLALHRIKLAVHPQNPQTELIESALSTQRGFSLQQIMELSGRLELDYQPAFREKGAAFVAPAVVHFKVDHFAALIRREGGRYLLEDPTFKNDAWVTANALEDEASGYFLVPPGELPEGWRSVESAEAETIWGRGFVPNPPAPPGPCDHNTDSCQPCPPGGPNGSEGPMGGGAGMAVASINLLDVALTIRDDAVGYSPPVGPAVRFIIRYNQRDNQFQSTFNYSNFGPKWTFDWLAYILDDPSNPVADVTYYIMGGGNRTFTGFNLHTQTFAFQLLDQTKLVRTSPASYEMTFRDGIRLVFGHSDGGLPLRRCFLTKLIDPAGNAAVLNYDSHMRIVGITDAIGQVTTLEYGLIVSRARFNRSPADMFKITKVTDPFGRSATFTYDASNRLIKITDVIGLTSEFTYDAGALSDFIVQLKTPYGVTSFTKSESGTTRSLEILYPDGERERVEFNQSAPGISGSDPPESVPVGMATRNQFLVFRNTFHWDRQACAHAYGDYTKARLYHWLHSADMQSPVGIVESVKLPLEGRVWYDYAGQSTVIGSIVVGSNNKPTHVGRVLDDGSTQLLTYEYNDFGKVTKTVDPIGRTFSYIYDANGIDLLEVRQTRGGQSELNSNMTYNFTAAQHRPLTVTDAAGQTTTYTYNARGQVVFETNALGELTIYHYDANGFRTSVDRFPGGTTHWTYDAVGRVKTKTDVSGYTLTFDYDDLDRLTQITYPDGTFDQFTYKLLDQTLAQDRAGRKTTFAFNSMRQMTKRTDPLNRAILFEWCKCGALRRLTDPMGRTTTWRHDVQGRVKCKEYADGSKVTYLYEDKTSRLRQRIDEKLQVTQYSYNRDGTVSQKTYTNAAVATPSVSFSYDQDYNRVTSMTDGSGTTRYSYYSVTGLPTPGAGQLAAILGPLPSDTIAYVYDKLGRRVTTVINGMVSSLSFDAAGRVTFATNDALGAFDYAYDGNSDRLAFQVYPNGQSSTLHYNQLPHDLSLQKITNQFGGTSISEFDYVRDDATGRITSWTQTQDGQTSTYMFGYDAADQLNTAAASPATLDSFSYTYDPAGNRLTEKIGSATTLFSYNPLNELTSVSGGIGTAASYQWDAEQRLVAVVAGNKTTQFTYDGLGRRVGIRQLVNGSEVSNRRFLWCDSEICEERTPSGAVTKRFFEQGVKIESGPAAGVYFYTRDHLGSIRELTDGAGTVRARYSYDPCGRRTLLAGDVETDFGFAGMFWATEAGLNLTLFRAYDAGIARWLSRDPLNNAEIDQGINLFAYVYNNPVNLVDPIGLCCEAEFKAWMLGIARADEAIKFVEDWALTVCSPLFKGLYGSAEGLAISALSGVSPIFARYFGFPIAALCAAAAESAAAVEVSYALEVWELRERYLACMARPCIHICDELPFSIDL